MTLRVYKTRRSGLAVTHVRDTGRPQPFQNTKTPEDPRPFGSMLEKRVYKALLANGWKDIAWQYPVLGGRVPGGLVVDFVVYTPMPIPVMVNGDYWHRNDDREFIVTTILAAVFGHDPVVIWGDEAQTQKDANRIVAQKIGRNV